MMTSLTQLIPSGKRLIEPFVGGGSVFMSMQHPELILSDANPALMNFYWCVKNSPDGLIEECKALFCEGNRNGFAYEAIRNQFNLGLIHLSTLEESVGDVNHAAQFLYINKFGFNGLYRTNRNGLLNVAFGKPNTLPSIPAEAILQMSRRLQNAQLLTGDFEVASDMAGLGDVLYLDPPYVDAKVHSPCFTGYKAGGFSLEDQARVADIARRAAARGATAIISNHNTEFTRALYAGAELTQIDVSRSISAKATSRGTANELLAVFRPS